MYRISFPEQVVYVPPEINNKDLLIIAQDPGAEERKAGKPLIGPSGKELMAALQKFGLKRKDVSLTNSCDCSWVGTETSPELQLNVIHILQIDLGIEKLAAKPKESLFRQLLKMQCMKKLRWEIENLNPSAILLMGKHAMEMFQENPYRSVTQSVGGNFTLDSGHTAYITIHPAAVLHASSKESQDAMRNEFIRGIAPFAQHTTINPDAEPNIQIINTISELETFTDFVTQRPLLAIDWETTGVDFLQAKITDLSVAWSPSDCAVIDLSAITDVTALSANDAITSLIEQPRWRNCISRILSCPAEKACHNGTFELLLAWANGLEINNFVYDTLIMMCMVDESPMHPKTLNALLTKYCNMGIYDSELYQYVNKNKRIAPELVAVDPTKYTYFGDSTIVPKDILFTYAGKDAIATFRAIEPLKKILKKEKSWDCYWEERYIGYPTAKMTFNGMLVDQIRGNEMVECAKQVTESARNVVARAYLNFTATQPATSADPIVKGTPLTERCQMQLSGCSGAINPKSPLIMDALFNSMGIFCPETMNSDGGKQSWREEVITELLKQFPEETLPFQHMALRGKLQYEKIQKQQSTYLINNSGEKGMLTQVHPKTGRVHSSFRSFGTETGRPSSKEPNLYNITNPEKLKDIFPEEYQNLDIRSLFPAPEGCKIVSMDYRQAEFRILAMDANYSQKQFYTDDKFIEGLIMYIAEQSLSNGSRYTPQKKDVVALASQIGASTYAATQVEWAAPMLEFFTTGLAYPEMDIEGIDPSKFVVRDGIPYWIDIHSWVASLIAKVKPWEVDKNLRRKAKTVIFGLNYGMMDNTLAARLGVLPTEAKRLKEQIYANLGNIDIYQKYIEYLATKEKRLRNVYGQIRHFSDELTAHNLREAIDYRPQSTVSKLMNRVVIQAYDLFEHQIPEIGAQMVLTVYDDFKFYCPTEHIDMVTPIVQDLMEQKIPKYEMSLPVDITIGDRWSEIFKEEEEE
jgi:DNA polymerase I-like protein with 3'-5' exonuclease and polymerase domains/uracil-DNA glycosylase